MKLNRELIFLLFLVALAASIRSWSLEFFQEQNTEQDKEKAKDLIIDAQALKGVSQSHGHMNVKFVQQKLIEATNLARHEDLIDQALLKEVEMAKAGYVVFYTAVPYMRLFQDITRKQFQKVVGYIGALQEKAFQFIRYTFNDPAYREYANVNQFLVKDLTKNGIIDDNQLDKKTILVSTNLAFFGNMGFTGESTYHYFNNPQPWASANPEWLQQSLRSFGYSEGFVPELMALIQSIVTDTGDLFQIFVPNKLVNQIGYLSWRQGIPFDVEFVNYMFGDKEVIIKDEQGNVKKEFLRKKMTFGRSDLLFAVELNERIADFKARYVQKDPEVVAWTNRLIQNVLKGKYHLVPFLDTYKRGSLPYTNFYQARLLITNDHLLNPASGIQIYRYSTLDKEREERYKEKLKDIFNRMEVERRKRLGISDEVNEEEAMPKSEGNIA